MLSGDNSILSRATQARTKTGNAQDEETISLAYLAAVTGKYADSSDMSTTLQTELEKTYGSGKVTVTKDGSTYTVTITGKGTYTIDANGKVEKSGPTIQITQPKVVANADGTGEDVTANTKKEGTDTLYISFVPTISGGNITSVKYNGNETVNAITIEPQNGIYVLEITKNGDYSFTITATADGETISSQYTKNVDKYDIRADINVGDYVNYTPKTASTTYSKDNLGEIYTGSTSNSSDLTQETLKWRVLKKYDDGRLDLIADPTNATVYFSGATGYNNGVYIMHDICEKLYSNTDHNITARSVSLEDFENNMTDAGENARNSYNNSENSPQYGHTNYEKWGSAYTKSNSYYPNIYITENGSGIDTENGAVKTDGIIDTAKGSLDLTTGSNAYKQATTGLTAKQTYYYISLNSTNYGDASKVLSQSNTFWVASRCVYCISRYARFGLRVADSLISGYYMFNSYGSTYDSRGRLRSVVSLGADVKITPSSTAQSATGTAHTINW